MLFPELIYSSFIRPQGRPPYTDVLISATSTTAAGPTILGLIQIPDDVDAIVQNLFYKLTVTGAETITRVAYNIQMVGKQPRIVDEDFAIGAAEYNKNFQNTPLYLPRGTSIWGSATKSAGVETLTVLFTMVAFFVPPMQL